MMDAVTIGKQQLAHPGAFGSGELKYIKKNHKNSVSLIFFLWDNILQ